MKKFIIGSAFFAPALAMAQTPLTNVSSIVTQIGRIIGLLIPITAALALLYFFWGLAQFILHSDDEEARKKARQQMIWGIVALFVIASVWGLVQFLGTAIGVDQTGGAQNIPTVNITPH